jgi:hypothetical protein
MANIRISSPQTSIIVQNKSTSYYTSPANKNIQINLKFDNNSSPSQNTGIPQSTVDISSPQFWNSNPNAIYNITPSYKAFTTYFVISQNDEYLSPIRIYLINNYGNYL